MGRAGIWRHGKVGQSRVGTALRSHGPGFIAHVIHYMKCKEHMCVHAYANRVFDTEFKNASFYLIINIFKHKEIHRFSLCPHFSLTSLPWLYPTPSMETSRASITSDLHVVKPKARMLVFTSLIFSSAPVEACMGSWVLFLEHLVILLCPSPCL